MPDHPGNGRRAAGGRSAVRWRAREPWVAGVLLLSLVLVPTAVAAQDRSSDELEQDVDETEQREHQVAEELDAVRAEREAAEIELAEIEHALEDARARLQQAEGQVALTEVALADAERERDRAIADHERAEQRLAATETELASEEAVFTDQVVETFKYGTVGATRGAMVMEVLRRAEDPNTFAVGLKQLQIVVDDQDSTVENVFELRELRVEQTDDAKRARARAAQHAADTEDILRQFEQQREEAAAIAVEVENKEQQQRELLASLRMDEAETEEYLERVAARKSELEEKLRAQRKREEEEARRKAEAAAAARSGPADVGAPGIDGMLCPVVGAVAGRDYINDWGFARSGGRSHQGNDMFASRGTPVVAVADGEVIRVNPPSSPTGLGGVTVTYRTGDGSEWYNAHLHTIADGISEGARVAKGQTIGTVGNTGNAKTTPPHLHIQRKFGGSWVNPWPTTSAVCR